MPTFRRRRSFYDCLANAPGGRVPPTAQLLAMVDETATKQAAAVTELQATRLPLQQRG